MTENPRSVFRLSRPCTGELRLLSECGDLLDGAVNAVFLCFRQEAYVAEAFRSVLQQSQRLDVIVVDDASDDHTLSRILAVLKEWSDQGSDRHRVRVYRQEKNVGIVENIRSAFRVLEIQAPVVIFEGDDVSQPNRVEVLLRLSAENPDAWILGSALALDDHFSEANSWYQPEIYSGQQRIGRGDWVVRACGMMISQEFIGYIDSFPRGLRTWDMAVNLVLILKFGRKRFAVCHDLLVYYRVLNTGETVTQSLAGTVTESKELMKSARNLLALSRLACRELARNPNVSQDDRNDTEVMRARWRADARRLMILAHLGQRSGIHVTWRFLSAACGDARHWRVYASGLKNFLVARWSLKSPAVAKV